MILQISLLITLPLSWNCKKSTNKDKEEIANIISSLNSKKASGPNSIPYRILFLLKNEISKQLADLFNLSFMTGVFPSVCKTAKVVPVLKKNKN